ncbi:MAG: MFS transporter [Enterobacteriaceae bacterium]|nr:MFS transporter [Enterobacteriaceae bacterium]
MKTLLKNKRFVAWATGLACDRLGNAMYKVVLPLMVYNMTASLKNMAIVTICQFLPRVFPGIYIGSMVDIFGKRTVFVLALFAQFLSSFVIAILYSAEMLHFIFLCILAAIASISFEFSRTTEMTLVPTLFAEQRVEATTVLASVHTAMFMLGPLLGALLLDYLNYNALLLFNALSSLAPLCAIYWTRIPNNQLAEHYASGIRAKLLLTNNSLLEAFRTIHLNKSLQYLMFFIISITLATGGLELLIIFYIKNRLHVNDEFASIMYAMGAAGMFCGSLLVPTFKKLPRKRFLFITLVMIASGITLFQSDNLLVLLLAQWLTFMGVFACSVTQDLIIQECAPIGMLGRISGLIRITNSAMLALSTLLVTSLAAVLSIKTVFVIVLLIILVAFLFTLSRHFSVN